MESVRGLVDARWCDAKLLWSCPCVVLCSSIREKKKNTLCSIGCIDKSGSNVGYFRMIQNDSEWFRMGLFENTASLQILFQFVPEWDCLKTLPPYKYCSNLFQNGIVWKHCLLTNIVPICSRMGLFENTASLQILFQFVPEWDCLKTLPPYKYCSNLFQNGIVWKHCLLTNIVPICSRMGLFENTASLQILFQFVPEWDCLKTLPPYKYCSNLFQNGIVWKHCLLTNIVPICSRMGLFENTASLQILFQFVPEWDCLKTLPPYKYCSNLFQNGIVWKHCLLTNIVPICSRMGLFENTASLQILFQFVPEWDCLKTLPPYKYCSNLFQNGIVWKHCLLTNIVPICSRMGLFENTASLQILFQFVPEWDCLKTLPPYKYCSNLFQNGIVWKHCLLTNIVPICSRMGLFENTASLQILFQFVPEWDCLKTLPPYKYCSNLFQNGIVWKHCLLTNIVPICSRMGLFENTASLQILFQFVPEWDCLKTLPPYKYCSNLFQNGIVWKHCLLTHIVPYVS